VLRVLGKRGERPGEFNYPTAIVGDALRLWVADSGNHRVQAVSPDGTSLMAFGRAGDAPGDLALPKSIGIDPDGHVYVVDGRFENIQVFNDAGQLLLYFGEEGSGPGQFWLPGGMFIEPGGRIWVCDSYNRRVQVFEYVREAEHAP
jgi:DNA-binding beta-propeller fold protein YncE